MTVKVSNKQKRQIMFCAVRTASRARKRCRAPTTSRASVYWSAAFNEQVNDIYRLAAWLRLVTGLPYNVDHIVPLRGAHVSGLCVPWNLKITLRPNNEKKRNRVERDAAVISYIRPTSLSLQRDVFTRMIQRTDNFNYSEISRFEPNIVNILSKTTTPSLPTKKTWWEKVLEFVGMFSLEQQTIG